MLAGFYEIVGENRFFSFARQLENRYRYGTISTREFIDRAVRASGLTGPDRGRLQQYFQQWLLRESRPALTPDDF